MKRYIVIFFLVFMFGVATLGYAEESGNKRQSADEAQSMLEPTIVTARGVATLLSNTPGGVGIVEQDDVELSPQASLADAAARIPGVSRAGESPWGQDINIRGFRGNSIIFLIDGKRVNTATETNGQFGFFQPYDVERIEVLKGPISSLYGSGSIGGVVNIITKKPAYTLDGEIHGEAKQNITTNPFGSDSYGRLAYSTEKFWVQLSGGRRGHEDYFGGDSTHMSNSQFEDAQGRIAAGFKWFDSLETELNAYYIEGNEIGIPGGTSTMPQTAEVTYPRTSNAMVAVDTTWAPKGMVLSDLLLSLYFMSNDRRVVIDKLPESMPIASVRPRADHETLGGKLQGMFALGEHTLVTGVDAWQWHMNSSRGRLLKNGNIMSDKPTPNSYQQSFGVFAEDDWKLGPDWNVNLGARLDLINLENDPYDTVEEDDKSYTAWNAHAGLTWRMTDEWSSNIIVASSYRAPDIMDRFKNISLGGGLVLTGNPDLDPETSYYAEAGLRYASGPFDASLQVYGNLVKDYITEEQVTDTAFTMENIGEAQIYGTELSLDYYFLDSLKGYASVAASYGRDENAGEPLRSIPPVNGLVGLRYEHGNGFWTYLENHWALEQDETPEGVDDTDGWAIVNAAAGYSFDLWGLENEVSLRVDNVFDEKYKNHLANARGMELYEPGINAVFLYSLAF